METRGKPRPVSGSFAIWTQARAASGCFPFSVPLKPQKQGQSRKEIHFLDSNEEWQKKYYRMLRLGERATLVPKPRQADSAQSGNP